jgi:hypothetical protein
MRAKENVHRIFVGKTGGKRPLERPKLLVGVWIILKCITEK